MDSEPVTSVFLEAGLLVLIGMMFVFLFLGLLIVCINLIAYLCDVFPVTTSENNGHIATTAEPAQQNVDNKIIAAISAALHAHRHSNKS